MKRKIKIPNKERLKDPEKFKKWKAYVEKVQSIIEEAEYAYHIDKWYFALIEYNKWENETWTFYCWYDNSTSEKMEKLLKALQEQWKTDGNIRWYIGRTKIGEAEVKYLVDTTESGYLDYHNMGEYCSIEDMESFVKCDVCVEDARTWYKGNYLLKCRCKK